MGITVKKNCTFAPRINLQSKTRILIKKIHDNEISKENAIWAIKF